jgi:hypothetical protein
VENDGLPVARSVATSLEYPVRTSSLQKRRHETSRTFIRPARDGSRRFFGLLPRAWSTSVHSALRGGASRDRSCGVRAQVLALWRLGGS